VNVLYVTGPGHGGPGVVANAYLEGTYSELYARVGRDEEGLQHLFRQFSFPGGIPSHAAPETPGSIHEGGELGYALAHAFGAAFDNPDLTVACVIGDGEAETGPLATSWHANKFLNPATDGAVLPILHLNGYKIANPTVLARIPEYELRALLSGYGWRALFVTGGFDGEASARVHQLLAETLNEAFDEIKRIQQAARAGELVERPTWPMIVLRTPKGWTCPRFVDGKPVEGTWRAHQVPLTEVRENDGHRRLLEEWMRSYRPAELFDEAGAVVPEIAELAPAGDRRMSANPHANGGTLLRDLLLPDFRDYRVDVAEPGCGRSEATRVLGAYLRDVISGNRDNFRIVGPDETTSNRLTAVFETTTRAWQGERAATDEGLGPDGRVLEVLSEHLCQGWLEGYLLTGRHGLFNCYEAFIHIIDSMFNQHAKWLKTSARIPWRMPLASLNYLLTSHVWQQDHNGFSHQDPGFIDHVVNKKAEVIRVYLPPDTNCLLSVMDHCLRSRHYVNVVVAGKAPALTYLSMDDAIAHCTRGIGIWEWASSDGDHEPDVVMACCGDVPTLETLAAVSLLRKHLPELRVRVVNVVDLMRLQSDSQHPHGLPDAEFDALFTVDRPVVFAYHGYPWLIHRLTYRRANHANLHVRGYKEEGTTTTPFDMVMLNDLDRFHLVMDVIDRVPGLSEICAHVRQDMQDERLRSRAYTREHGEDRPDVSGWTWPG
jgi:xylulose-5-phosphate/fructose-6-phosphate phosphoketolase